MRAQSQTSEPAQPVDRLRLPLVEPVEVGMPQLCRAGLSENWLLKECGHRHWLALAHAFSLDVPDFVSEVGDRLYPAFTKVALSNSRLRTVRENDELAFELELERIGHTRFASDIKIQVGDASLANLRMESAFVRRAVPGSNRSATRSTVAQPCRLQPPLTRQNAPFRPESWEQLDGFIRADRVEIARMTVDPSPHEDFNGVEFLYFSAFQAIVDRAEWHWLRRAEPLLHTSARTIHYLGNIELGDQVSVVLCGLREDRYGVAHWVELRRASDDGLFAVAFTHRKFAGVRGAETAWLRGGI